jgi:hypothetical protein
MDKDTSLESTSEEDKVNIAMFTDSEAGEGKQEAPTNEQDETDADASITTENRDTNTRV